MPRTQVGPACQRCCRGCDACWEWMKREKGISEVEDAGENDGTGGDESEFTSTADDGDGGVWNIHKELKTSSPDD